MSLPDKVFRHTPALRGLREGAGSGGARSLGKIAAETATCETAAGQAHTPTAYLVDRLDPAGVEEDTLPEGREFRERARQLDLMQRGQKGEGETR